MTDHPSKTKGNNLAALRPTMREVARLAGGIHPSTVSLALRNSPRVSVQVRAEIQAIANKLGYRRDPLLDAFNQHRLKVVPQRASRHIAAISDFSSAAELAESPHHAAARVGAMAAATRLHCQLDFFFCGKGQPTPRRLDTVLEARGLRALLLFGVQSDSVAMEFNSANRCTVAIDSAQLKMPLYRVTPAYREATRLLWRRAWTQGCHRIAMIRTGNAHPSTEDRAVAGYLLEQLRQPQATPIPVFTLDPSTRGYRSAFKKWFLAHRPEVILHSSGLSKMLTQLLPESPVRCQAFDALSPGENGVCPDYDEVGQRAVEQLLTLMQTNQLGPPVSSICTYVAVALPS